MNSLLWCVYLSGCGNTAAMPDAAPEPDDPLIPDAASPVPMKPDAGPEPDPTPSPEDPVPDPPVAAVAPQPYASYWFPDELLAWSPETDSEAPFNRSAVPLASRTIDSLAPVNSHARAEARIASLAIFDATSGHAAQGAWDKLDTYAFAFWQYLDLMVMWGGSAGEGLILAPAPYITDAGHRNGVPVLGTVFFPPVVYGGQWQWVTDFLQQDPDGGFPVADKLIAVASYYGFDGWFINQETVGGDPASAAQMQAFMKYFQAHKKPDMRIFWYDSMIDTGTISWQNELNSSNAMFFEDNGLVSDEIFLNFWWDQGKIERSNETALALGRNPYDVYAGIDVQANGYNTSVNWSALFPDNQAHPLSLAMYVPSWTFHSAAGHGDFVTRESRFWVGANGDPRDTNTTDAWKGIAHYVPARTPITSLPFVTHFNAGQGYFYNIAGSPSTPRAWHNLSVMDVMPTWRWIVDGGDLRPEISWSQAYNGGSSLRISGTLAADTPVRIPLYKSDIVLPQDARATVVFKHPHAEVPVQITLLLGTEKTLDGSAIAVDIGTSSGAGWTTRTVSLAPYVDHKITSIQLRLDASSQVLDYELFVGQLALYTGNRDAPSPPGKVTLMALEHTSPTQANLRVRWQPSTDAVRMYNLFQERGDGTRVFLGATPNTAYFVNNIERPDSSNSSDSTQDIIVQAVGVDYGLGAISESRMTVDWSQFTPPPPPPKTGPNLIGGGIATTQYDDSPSAEGVDKAFDNDDQSKWLTFHKSAWIQYDFAAVTPAVLYYGLVSANDAPARDPRSWQLFGGDGDGEWILLDERSEQSFPERFQQKVYTCAQPGAYRSYRLVITENHGAGETQLAELQLYAGE